VEALIARLAEEAFPLGVQDDQDSEQYEDIDDIDSSVIPEDDIPTTTFLSGDTPEDEGPTADIGIEGVLVQGESDPISYCGAWLHAHL
jgi:hypothetical protein